jgi:GT2 family glycosyltransferase
MMSEGEEPIMTTSKFNYRDDIVPYFQFEGKSYYRLQGIDKYIHGDSLLFLASNAGLQYGAVENSYPLEKTEWLGGGTFRNSFYLEPLINYTRIRKLKLLIDYQGAIRLKLMYASYAKNRIGMLREVKLHSAERAQYLLDIGSSGGFPEASRLFWHIDALDDGVAVYDVSYVTNETPRSDCRLAVLLRTFGRTTDVKRVLRRFAEAGQEHPHYSAILDQISFWLLDTTADCESEYHEQWQNDLNLRILIGPNLGGGGNASHLLRLFDEACLESDRPPTELLILDDDLSLSPETLARYFMFCAYRSKEVISSLPVLMKSQPTVVWEDGGFWGRLNFHEGGTFSKKRNLFPNLVKHGLRIDTLDPINEFCPLNSCEYSTFIFFGLSVETFRKLGYPPAFFLRGDDIEYSLRAYESGIPMMTNPNLAAWHEPAHSYGQEYMAVMHGIIINLTYGEHGADFFTRFFEERLCEHALIGDIVGIQLYMDILSELVNPVSSLLTPDFQSHYVSRLKSYSQLKMTLISERDRAAYEKKARENKILIVPFVYPGLNKDTGRYQSVILFNQSARAYREVSQASFSMKADAMQKYLDLLRRFSEHFDEVQEFWQARLKQSATRQYWDVIKEKYHDVTKEISRSEKEQGCSDTLNLDRATFEAQEKSYRQQHHLWKDTEASILKAEISTYQLGLEQARKRGLIKRNSIKRMNRKKLTGLFGNLLNTLGKGKGNEQIDLSTLPADFDPVAYLNINKDVKAEGVDPAIHYVKFGRQEGRKYRV